MRTLGIDLGTRRIGLAVSDESGRFVTPYDVIQVTDAQQAIEPIAKLILAEGIERVVIGLPLNMDDSFGPAARGVVTWGKLLGAKVTATLLYVDERLSSFEAEQSLVARKKAGEKMTRKAKKSQLDAVAAATFLRDYLEGRLLPVDLPE